MEFLEEAHGRAQKGKWEGVGQDSKHHGVGKRNTIYCFSQY